MVVTATRSERSAEDVPVSVTVVSREAIVSTPARTLDDAIRTVVGLNLPLGSSNVIQPITNHVSMRGLGGDRALALLDGVPLNDPVTGYVQWNKAPLGIVEQVEVVRGAGASLFGNYAMGGTVNILTHPLRGNRVEAEAAYGTFDTRRLSASVIQGLGAGVTAGVFLDTEDTDGYIRTVPEERGAIDVPSSSRSFNLQVKLQLAGTEGSRAFVRANVLDHDLQNGTRIDNTKRRIYDVAAGGRFRLGAGLVSASAFYQDSGYSADASLLVPGTGRDQEYRGSHSERPGRDAGSSVQWSLETNGPVKFVTGGLDVRRVGTDENAVTYDRFGNQTGTRTSEGSQTFVGLFGEVSVSPLERLEVLLSARLNSWKNSGGKEQAGTAEPTEYPDVSATRLDPRLSLRYEVGQAIAVRGAVYKAFRAPTLAELYRSNATRTFQIIANPELGPETLFGGDLGVDVMAGPFRGQLNLFRNQVDGLVARATVSSKPILVVQPKNLGSARSQGMEVMGTTSLGRGLSLDVGYAFTDSVITDNAANPDLVGNQIPDVPRHAGSLALRWSSPFLLEVALRGRAQSKRYGDDANQLVVEAHSVLDLFVSFPVARTLEIYAQVENLLNREYVADVNVGQRLGSPRAFFAGLRFRKLPAASAPGP